jgi:uncharacterized protein with GYD domain
MQAVKVDLKKISESRSTAYILLNTEMGAEREVLSELKKIENVKEVYRVHGVYDVIVKIEAETMEKLKEIAVQEIRKLDNVRSILTMIVTDSARASKTIDSPIHKKKLIATHKVHCPIGDCDVIVKSWTEDIDTVKCPNSEKCRRSVVCAYGQLEE